MARSIPRAAYSPPLFHKKACCETRCTRRFFRCHFAGALVRIVLIAVYMSRLATTHTERDMNVRLCAVGPGEQATSKSHDLLLTVTHSSIFKLGNTFHTQFSPRVNNAQRILKSPNAASITSPSPSTVAAAPHCTPLVRIRAITPILAQRTMVAVIAPKDRFHWSQGGEPHSQRRREILAKYGDQVRKLYGYDNRTAYQVCQGGLE